MSGTHNHFERRRIRRYRIRKRVVGSAERPRLSVFRSASHIYAQIIDDTRGVTLAAASSREDLGSPEGKGKTAVSTAVGKLLAERAKQNGVARVCFDRGGYLYHGRIKALADGARAGGLEF
ncbi:MAG: 50S ribosomal protein L18 [Candidatus Eisenbacteria bacterium]|uniref:Large ribosomal subunit protein uL18 n=1 Tax=Eiseniibacteriota bacterium TaxID=2212470 RepID=A0A9D6QJ80_UNCEI|nr:50S ribosomal protein L18 [Candidatus Eisenbacteria bacterium]MBI3538940.1 50S ribosomal protein L18 [Candidatus Eisenbacteria bacterium]